MKTDLELSPKELLDKFFTCALDEEEKYIKQLAAFSSTLVIDIDFEQLATLQKQFTKNKKDLFLEYGFGLDEFQWPHRLNSITTIVLIVAGLLFSVFAIACLCITFLVPGGFILFAGGVTAMIAAIGCLTEFGFRLVHNYQVEKVELQYPLHDLHFFEEKLSHLLNLHQFETIYCLQIYLSDLSHYFDRTGDILDDINEKMNETAVFLPAKITYYVPYFRASFREENETIQSKLECIDDKAKTNDLRNKHRLFYHAGVNLLLSDLRIKVFTILKGLYFPLMPLYKEISQEPTRSLEI